MNENAEFFAKLTQIEEMANELGAQLGAHAKTRAQHIAILARALRARLELIDPPASPDDAGGPQEAPR